MRYERKPKVVNAMQLTMENLHEVEAFSKGRIKAVPTKSKSPSIQVQSTSDKIMWRYADPTWWLLVEDDGSFDVMVSNHFERDFTQSSSEPCEGSNYC